MHDHYWFHRARGVWRTTLTIIGFILLVIFGKRATSTNATVQAMGPHRANYPIALNQPDWQLASPNLAAGYTALHSIGANSAQHTAKADVQVMAIPAAPPTVSKEKAPDESHGQKLQPVNEDGSTTSQDESTTDGNTTDQSSAPPSDDSKSQTTQG